MQMFYSPSTMAIKIIVDTFYNAEKATEMFMMIKH